MESRHISSRSADERACTRRMTMKINIRRIHKRNSSHKKSKISSSHRAHGVGINHGAHKRTISCRMRR